MELTTARELDNLNETDVERARGRSRLGGKGDGIVDLLGLPSGRG